MHGSLATCVAYSESTSAYRVLAFVSASGINMRLFSMGYVPCLVKAYSTIRWHLTNTLQCPCHCCMLSEDPYLASNKAEIRKLLQSRGAQLDFPEQDLSSSLIGGYPFSSRGRGSVTCCAGISLEMPDSHTVEWYVNIL